MPSTPRTRRTRSSATNTPGAASVAASVGSTGDTGVPWSVQKALAQEIEKAFPFDDIPLLSDTKNSTQALFDSGTQALDRLLNQLVKDNPDDNLDLYGLRGSEKRGPIGDLAQYWKKKERENYFVTVIRRFSVKQSGSKSTPLPKTPQTKEDRLLRV